MTGVTVLAFASGLAASAVFPGPQSSRSEPILAIVRSAQSRWPILTRLDRRSLEPVGPAVSLGEYHWTSSLSPDGSQLALGISAPRPTGRVGMAIVDLERMEAVVEVVTGIAAEAVAWLGPNRVVAALQRGGIVVADSTSGEVVRRWPEPFRPPNSPPVAKTERGVIFLLVHPSEPTAARLVLVEDSEHARFLSLDSIATYAWRNADEGVLLFESAGLAVDAGDDRAFVVAPGAPVAEVNLRNMSVSYHEVEGLDRRGQGGWRQCLLLENAVMAVFGADLVPEGKRAVRVPAGLALIDMRTWRARTVDREASRAVVVSGGVLAYHPGSNGLRVYSAEGEKLYELFSGERVRDVRVDGDQIYVLGATVVWAVDAESKTIARELTPSVRLLEVIGNR